MAENVKSISYNDFQHILVDEEFKKFTKNYHGERSTQLAIFIHKCECKAVAKHIYKVEKFAQAVKEAIFGPTIKQKPQERIEIILEALKGLSATDACTVLRDAKQAMFANAKI